MSIQCCFKKIVQEPLFVFLFIGGGLFALYDQVADDFEVVLDDNSQIEVTETQINSLAANFEKMFRRAPNTSEIDNMVDEFIRDEVLYREAIAMELDKGDIAVRRRLLQVIDFISEDLVSLAQPQEHELQALLETYPDRYRQADRYSFSQVFINPTRHGDATEQHAAQVLAQLRADDSQYTQLGDNSMLPHRFSDAQAWEVERQLGERFKSDLMAAESGQWIGPIHSRFGKHLIKIDAIDAGGQPSVDEIRDVLIQDLQFEKTLEARDVYYAALRDQYQVRIERDGQWHDAAPNSVATEVVQ
ncbi:peptidylprolyl isomerase [Ferrimonas pelagia]|uniref:peptidylprolyl isomerase n=1 Tax=Ferrimonas pelagia TaxID=1177826 RepID=A0ABP9F5W3_9GAMM